MVNQHYYMVREFAKLAGVTVRTLHFYDREGLLKPSEYTGKKHRLYAQQDLLRLQQIITLKHLGFSLKEIGDVLKNPGYNIRESLRIQKEAIDGRILQMQVVSYALARTLEKADSVEDIDWNQVTAIIQGLSDADKAEWMTRYYPPEQQELWNWVHERAVQMPPDYVQASVKAWENVYADFRELMHLPPDDPRVQALAEQAHRLVEGFTQSNPELEQMLERMYSDPSQIPDAYRVQQFEPALQEFMQQAVQIYRNRRAKP
jgi:MerR family transcriptional regulator, thiopeptide resistance regulator